MKFSDTPCASQTSRSDIPPKDLASPSVDQPLPIPLKEQIQRGVDWVVFVWQMLRRLGGPLDILRTIWMIVSVLVTRLLVQQGLIKKSR